MSAIPAIRPHGLIKYYGRVRSGLLLAALYMLNIFSPIFAPPWDALGRLSPFYYYRSLQIMQTATLDADAVVIYLGITTISLLAAVIVFQRKDLVR